MNYNFIRTTPEEELIHNKISDVLEAMKLELPQVEIDARRLKLAEYLGIRATPSVHSDVQVQRNQAGNISAESVRKGK